MARAPRPRTPVPWWVAGALVGVLAVAVIVVSVLAIAHGRETAPTAETPRPVPTFTAARTPTPTPTASPAPAVADPGAAERFLAVGDGAMWRAVAGACNGPAPTLERSTDGGATWSDVTPRYRNIARIDRVDPFAGSQAEMVAAIAGGCQTQALRTFTGGQFWDPYPDVLAASTYIDPQNPASIVTPTGSVAAPCPQPYGLRGSRSSTIGVICDGTVYVLPAGGQWSALPVTGAAAIAMSDSAVLVAHAAEGCAGTQVDSVPVAGGAGAVVGCAAAADPQTPLALAATGTTVTLWAGANLVQLPG